MTKKLRETEKEANRIERKQIKQFELVAAATRARIVAEVWRKRSEAEADKRDYYNRTFWLGVYVAAFLVVASVVAALVIRHSDHICAVCTQAGGTLSSRSSLYPSVDGYILCTFISDNGTITERYIADPAVRVRGAFNPVSPR